VPDYPTIQALLNGSLIEIWKNLRSAVNTTNPKLGYNVYFQEFTAGCIAAAYLMNLHGQEREALDQEIKALTAAGLSGQPSQTLYDALYCDYSGASLNSQLIDVSGDRDYNTREYVKQGKWLIPDPF